MSTPAWLQLVVFLGLLLALAWPLARAIDTVMAGRFSLGRRVEAPLWRLAGVQPERESGWLRYLLGLLVFNGLGVVAVYALQRLQHALPLNPQGFGSVTPDSAFNTAISFMSNTNWQGYGGESTMSYVRDVADHLARINATIDGLRDTIATAIQVNLSLVTIDDGAVTKRLAAWASIFAVWTAFAGIWGMNFEFMPELKWRYGYVIALGVIATACGVLFYRFRRIGWL